MRIFISWSGSKSNQIAKILRDWLPNVLQFVKLYVSSEDIDKGVRWGSDIAKELEVSSYGIIILTKENVEAPWIMFEAGALSKTLDKAKVSPFLFNVKRSDVKGPLIQFQSTMFDKDEIFKLLISINNSAEKENKLEEDRLKHIFDVFWPELKSNIDKVTKNDDLTYDQENYDDIEILSILEELLELARNQQRIVTSTKGKDDFLERFTLAFHRLHNKMGLSNVMLDKIQDDLRESLKNNNISASTSTINEIITKIDKVNENNTSCLDLLRHVIQPQE